MPKQTFQPSKRRQQKKHGFFKRMANSAGKRVLKRRSLKGRSRLAH